MRVLVVVQRYNALSEPWIGRIIEGLGSDCVGVAGRTHEKGRPPDPNLPFMRLRSRNVVHRLLPKPLRRWSPLRPAMLLTGFAKSLRADRVLCHYGTSAVEYAEAWDRLDVPLFVYFHGLDTTLDLREQLGQHALVHAPEYKHRMLELSRRATFIANSEHTKRRLLDSGVGADRVVVNYLGVDPPAQAAKTTPARPRILFVGRFVDCKGPDLTIRAFDLLRSQGCDAELVMVGDGPQREACLAIASASPYSSDIHLPGAEPVEAVQARLLAATVFTLHSQKGPISNHEEAFGVSVVEAMAAGLPVVGGRSGGVPEIVQDGVTGFLVQPGDVEAQAQRLKDLIENPALASKMGAAGRDRVLGHFSQRRSIENLRRILGAADSPESNGPQRG